MGGGGSGPPTASEQVQLQDKILIAGVHPSAYLWTREMDHVPTRHRARHRLRSQLRAEGAAANNIIRKKDGHCSWSSPDLDHPRLHK